MNNNFGCGSLTALETQYGDVSAYMWVCPSLFFILTKFPHKFVVSQMLLGKSKEHKHANTFPDFFP